MEKLNRSTIRKVVKELVNEEPQLSLFPYSDIYRVTCNSIKVCWRQSCVGCRFSDIIRKDYDFFSNPVKY